jgi:predicted enzyme related to lactoylglutathione lyase
MSERIDYVELPGGDLPATKAFYTSAFGWGFVDYGPTYAGFADAGLDGGLATGEAAVTTLPLVILKADDLEDALARVEAAGGEITAPIYPFPGGRRFQFRDPAGNELAVWSVG